jgi:hypothetical protein
MDTATLKTVGQRGKDELRATLISLTEACPVDEYNPEECPLYWLRKMNSGQRLHWFNALDEDDLVYLASYHHVCMNIKVELKSAENFP